MSSGVGLWLDTPANKSGAKSHPKFLFKSCQLFQGVTEPANFEALLGGFHPPNSAFSSPKSKLEVGVRRNKVKGGEVGRQRGRGGRQLTTDQVSIHGSFFPDFVLRRPFHEGDVWVQLKTICLTFGMGGEVF